MDLQTIPQFNNYAISKDGKVWSYLSKKFLKPVNNGYGYQTVHLRFDTKTTNKYIHRLVLETFIGPCPEGMEACHSDGNKSNNCLSNLRWDTSSANTQDTLRHGTFNFGHVYGERHGRSKLKEQDVRMIIYIYKTGLFTQQEIADLYYISCSSIKHIVNKRTWKYLWTK